MATNLKALTLDEKINLKAIFNKRLGCIPLDLFRAKYRKDILDCWAFLGLSPSQHPPCLMKNPIASAQNIIPARIQFDQQYYTLFNKKIQSVFDGLNLSSLNESKLAKGVRYFVEPDARGRIMWQ